MILFGGLNIKKLMEGIEPSSESLEDFCSTFELHEHLYSIESQLGLPLKPSLALLDLLE